jgi:hypothetical protein
VSGIPYIVTTKRPQRPGGPAHITTAAQMTYISRRAVPTPDKVWDHLPREARKHLIGLPESGGTVGPLPDGTVIEVEQVDLRELRKRAG